MEADPQAPLRAARTGAWPEAAGAAGAAADPAAQVTALYHEHALSLIRVAHIMLGSRPAAEDIVQEAFCGLYRRWRHLASTDKALSYVRSCVLNGCRSALRKDRARPAEVRIADQPDAR